MQSVDLSGLKYVAYLLWAVTFVFYMAARLQTRRTVKGWCGAATGVAAFLALFTLAGVEIHQQRYSPRVFVAGRAVQVIEETHKGSYSDDLVLRLPNNAVTPLLETGYLGQTANARHFLRGDTLAIQYRVWDNKVLYLVVLEGRQKGWTYVHGSPGWSGVYLALLAPLFGFGYALWQWNRHRQGDEVAPVQQSRRYPPEITTLGLSASDEAQ